jgi:hypothetical protein
MIEMFPPHVIAPRFGLLQRLPRLSHEILLHVALLLLVSWLTFFNYQRVPPTTIHMEGDQGVGFRGFYEAEHTQQFIYRWSSGVGSVCFDRYSFGPMDDLSATLLGQGAVPLGITAVTLLANDQPIANVPLRAARQQVHFVVSSAGQDRGELCITFMSDTAQRPGDDRVLGVPIERLTLQRLPGAIDRSLLIQLIANLALAGGGFWLLRAAGAAAWAAALAIAIGSAALSIGMSNGWLVGGIGMTRNVLPLAGASVLLLLGEIGARQLNRFRLGQPNSARLWLAHDLVSMLFWSILLVATVWWMQLLQGNKGFWPIKGGVELVLTPWVLLPIALFGIWLAIILRMLARERVARGPALLLVVLGAGVLPVILKIATRGLDSVFYTFRDNPNDYIRDVPLIDHPIAFLGRFVTISPTLTLHNRNHPPGSVLLLWSIAQLFGAGAAPATWMVIALGSLSAAVAFWLGQRVGGWPAGLLAGAIYAVMPGHQFYSVTSMDIVFVLLLSAAATTFFLALEPGARPWLAVLAGALIAVGLFFTYAATQLLWFGVAVCICALLRRTPLSQVLRQGGLVTLVLIGIYALLAAATGFNIIAVVRTSIASNSAFMGRTDAAGQLSTFTSPSLAYYVYYLGANLIAYLWFLAPWGMTAWVGMGRAALQRWRSLSAADTLTLGFTAWIAGMWLSGLFIRETERVWGFTYPLAAVLIAMYAWQGATTQVRVWRAALFTMLCFAMSVFLRMTMTSFW